MDFTRAFSYVFDDRQWTEKLVITGVVSVVAIVPLFGLLAVAALLGYLVELVQNMRSGKDNPLPRWDNFGEKMALGGNVLVAFIVYNLPNLLLICCAFSIPLMSGAGRNDFFAGTFTVGLVCCLIPLLLIYNLLTFPMLALGTIRYSEARQVGVFFQFGDLFATISEQLGVFGQWMLFSFLVSIIFGVVNSIPCLGWIVSLALTIPVYGHLLGQLALALNDKRKGKPKRYTI